MQDTPMKTTVELPKALWQAAKIRAIHDDTDLKHVVIAALESYLKRGGKQS
jgi:hypothetical protein